MQQRLVLIYGKKPQALEVLQSAIARRRKFTLLKGDASKLRDEIDLVVTYGGDGTFLQAASLFPERAPTFMPISGGSLGFMLPWELRKLKSAFPSIADGTIVNRMRLSVSIEGHANMTALNEVNIHRGASPSLTRLDCSINGQLLTEVIADGGNASNAHLSAFVVIPARHPAVFLRGVCHCQSLKPRRGPSFSGRTFAHRANSDVKSDYSTLIPSHLSALSGRCHPGMDPEH
ncbi:hypothetical protein PSACC_03507 [Paramicrosporidium saccamoebae]|uniref:Uncharacterized protein n=1 Tax=Paramicrosporidium saccamoebae TaxID=1246581 RepID=A0A2H9TGB6_9FUNG|nr:hypothetical protein PSACC_03507 [Paramicrosporidium saccamoebae]